MGLKIESLSVNLPFGLGGANIVVTEAQRKVTWALYVELATRVAGVKLEPSMGFVREALNSLYSLFETTRTVRTQGGRSGVTIVIDEPRWPQRDAFYQALEENRQNMLHYIQILARIAGVYHEKKD